MIHFLIWLTHHDDSMELWNFWLINCLNRTLKWKLEWKIVRNFEPNSIFMITNEYTVHIWLTVWRILCTIRKYDLYIVDKCQMRITCDWHSLALPLSVSCMKMSVAHCAQRKICSLNIWNLIHFSSLFCVWKYHH